jgi:uncharacterized damage-inducible protein DinB
MPMDDTVLRRNLVELLRGGHAHVALEKALKGLDPELRTRRPKRLAHSVWELFEHIRIAQEDILRYTLDPAWKSPEWPAGYWPANPRRVEDDAWSDRVRRFGTDLDEAIRLVRDKKLDLTAEIPHGEGRTYLRQVLLIADHNAYHIGQIVDVRRALGDWPG